jgi:MFS family permease
MVISVFTLTALSFGTMGSISVFLKPLSNEFGWTRANTAFGYTVASLGSAFFGIIWGYVADKYGTRLFGFFATFFMVSCLFFLGKQNSILHFYVLYFCFGAFGNAVVGSPLYANVGFWFKKNPGLALGITAAGGAAGQGIIPLLSTNLIQAYGWQVAYMYLSYIYLFIMAPFSFLIKESPRRKKARIAIEDEFRDFPLSEKEVITWISCAVVFCCICMSVPIVHLIPLLTDASFSEDFAASVFLVLMIFGIVGRIISGKLGDMIGALPTYILMSIGQTISVLGFPYIDFKVGLFVLAAAFGFTYSGVMSAILVCARMMVSAKLAGRAMALGSFFGWVGMGLGGYFGGLLFDIKGDYTWSYQFASAMGSINIFILWQFHKRIKKQEKANALK